jgi:fatty acid desaturase
MKKMSRTLARASIVMVAIGCVLLFFTAALSNIWLAVIGSIVMIASLLVKAFLKCPNCGHGGMVPQWSKSGTIHCPKCGKAVEYDI